MRFVDVHLHLSDYDDPDPLLRWSRSSETLLVTAGTDKRTSLKGAELAAAHPGLVFAMVGTHPSEAEKEPGLGWLGGALPSAAGLGEVGLDPKYSDIGPSGAQSRVLTESLSAAERFGKPVEVHSRGAEEECLAMLSGYRLSAVLFHWLADESAAKVASDRGYYASFGPALLYSKKLARIAGKYPRELVVTESDGPVPYEALGGASGPSLIPSVVNRIARTRGESFEDSRETCAKNAMVFLGIGKG